MARRSTKYKVIKHNRLQGVAKSNGDLLYRVFQCLNYNCSNLITVKEQDIIEADGELKDFSIKCPNCGFEHIHGGETVVYNYSLEERDDELSNDPNSSSEDVTWTSIETGNFVVRHDQYVSKSPRFKYCVICSTLQPVEKFSIHSSRRSGRQSECITCKDEYNSFKNGTRTPEQFAESAQKRRLYGELAGNEKINYKKIREKFDNKCFNCGTDVSSSGMTAHLDHTLPAKYLWSLNTESATLLCSTCNGNKSGTWPGLFYPESKLRELVIRTGFSYDLLKGPEKYSPEALKKLKDQEVVDSILKNYAKYFDEIIKIRNRILEDTGYDFFSVSKIISNEKIQEANLKLGKQ